VQISGINNIEIMICSPLKSRQLNGKFEVLIMIYKFKGDYVFQLNGNFDKTYNLLKKSYQNLKFDYIY